jgi:hypothetical protein
LQFCGLMYKKRLARARENELLLGEPVWKKPSSR